MFSSFSIMESIYDCFFMIAIRYLKAAVNCIMVSYAGFRSFVILIANADKILHLGDFNTHAGC